MHHLFSRIALMSGNFVTGLAVLAPAGMLPQLAEGLRVSIGDGGLLVTYGAVVLCLASPLVSWVTTRIDRRMLLSATLAAVAAAHFASAAADSYSAVLVLRLFMLLPVALYTPQAASTIALIVPERARAGAIAFVFLGWSLAIAAGLPLIAFVSSQFGWRETFIAIGVCAAAGAMLNLMALPNALTGHVLSLQSFVAIARHPVLLLLLLITLLQMSGQFTISIYLAPLLGVLADAGTAGAAVFFSLLGVSGLAGNMLAAAIVTRAGLQPTLGFFMVLMALGAALFALAAGNLIAMGIGIVVLGLGITAANSMQQARLVVAAPLLASATVALNSAVLYVGQALGSATAGLLYAAGHFRLVGFVALAFYLAAILVFLLTIERKQVA